MRYVELRNRNGTAIINLSVGYRRKKVSEQVEYHIFMLRVWKESESSPDSPVRLSVENTRTGARVGFTEWRNLVEYINSQASKSPMDETGD